MSSRWLAIAVLSFSMLLTGCATPTQMAFSDDAGAAAVKAPVYLVVLNIRNDYKISHQPKVIVLHVEKEGAKDKADRINFKMDAQSKMETNTPGTGNTYLARMELPPGKYVIPGFSSMASSFPVNGFFFTPIHAKLEVKESGIFYLGNISAVVRERKGEEFKAGPSIPLIDQAVTGASGGTFDVVIKDDFERDMAMFQSRFSALKNVTVTPRLLPPFDRQVAQKWWQEN